MKLRDLFKRKGQNKTDETIDVYTETAFVDNETFEIPKVIFEDLELQVTIGQWLGILSSRQGFGTEGITFYTHLSAEELMKKTNISAKDLDNISKKFGELFKMAGVDNSETCVLSQYDKEKFTFNCHFNNAGDSANISMRWGDPIENMPELKIDYHNNSKTYYFNESYENKPMKLSLEHYTLTNPENGNEVYRYLSKYRSSITLRNEDYQLTIENEKPINIEFDIFNDRDYVYKLRNEEELKQYLLGLSFPITIDEVYKKICELSLENVSEYPMLSIKVEKNINSTSLTTDLIYMNNGQLTKFVITRNGRTISLDNKDNWSFKTSEVTVSQNNEGIVNYSLHSIPKDMLDGVIKPSDLMKTVNQEVENVKTLSKTLFK